VLLPPPMEPPLLLELLLELLPEPLPEPDVPPNPPPPLPPDELFVPDAAESGAPPSSPKTDQGAVVGPSHPEASPRVSRLPATVPIETHETMQSLRPSPGFVTARRLAPTRTREDLANAVRTARGAPPLVQMRTCGAAVYEKTIRREPKRPLVPSRWASVDAELQTHRPAAGSTTRPRNITA
jgi:hypothetical protein